MKQNKGITLVALVITIIVLLILAGIVISLALGEHGLVQMARKSKEEYSREEARGKLELVLLHMQAEKETKEEYNQNEYLTSKIKENGMIVNEDIILVDGWEFTIDRNTLEILSNEEKSADSLIKYIKYIRNSGNYEVQVEDETYSIHAYVYNGDQTWDSMVFGDENDVGASGKYAQNMVVVKVNGDLTINKGATITAYNTAYGGPKGMFIYCTGTLTNNGTISMTGKGAYAVGQNVYLWKNEGDKTYEYVPAVGAAGGTRVSKGGKNTSGTTAGRAGASGTERRTGGGGSGAATKGQVMNYTVNSGAGAAGTSYSGGAGGGGASSPSVSISGKQGGTNGGAGGAGTTKVQSGNTGYAGGGAGNPGGNGSQNNNSTGSYKGANGTGGLLIIYANNVINAATISSNGSLGGNKEAAGGSSGGGSINIFYKENYQNTGAITATSGKNGNGGAGGTGSITVGSIATGSFVSK